MFPSFSSFPAQRELITGGDKDDKKKRKRNKKVRKEYNEYSTKYDFPKTEIPDFELEVSADFRIDKKGNSKILKYQEIRDELVPIYKRPRYIFDDYKKNPDRRLKYREYSRKETIPMIKCSDLNVDMVPDTLDGEFISLPHVTADVAPPNTAEATSKVLEFNHQLKKDPQNTKLWLDFINFQNTFAGKNATAKKISIFERAMDINNDPVLVIKYMELLAEVEDEKAVLKQWDHVLSNNPTLDLWISYIDYKSRIRFQYTEICELYAEALYNFSSDGDEPMLHLFYRLCWLQRQCGYEERGIGMFQALIEYNIFPDEDIAEFWDSENPRFGEVGSRTYQFLGLRSGSESDHTNQENVHSNNWQQKETALMRKDWLPLRKSMHEAVDDPFRTVLFEDVQPYLFVIKSAFAIQQLISQFLRYVGFPFAVISCSNSLMSKDYLLNDELLQSDQLWLFGDSPRNFPILSQYKLPGSLLWKHHQWPTIIDSETIKIQSKGKIEFIFQLLEQGSVYYRSRTTPKCYSLLLEFLWSKQDGLKMSKQILKDDPTNLEIWKFYSYFVRDSANGIEKAIKVLTTTISMLHKLPKDSLKEAAKIYGSLAEAYLITKNFQKCIESLVAFTACSDLKAVNSSEIENARRSYQNMLDVAADIQNLDSLKDIFFNYCLLELLTTPLEGAGKPLYGVANAIPPNTVANELFHETILYSVLLFVSASGVNQSRVIKEVLYSCLNHYPNNVMFLSAYVATQSQVQIKHQLRRALKEMLDTNPSELLWLFLIWTEQQGSKNLNVVRATFDEALKQSGKIGIQLFVMAIRFEVYCNDFQRAKRIFYHAISEYPWAKELYMLAFRDLEAVLSGDEVNELIQSMEEKEIRFRIPFGG